MIMRSGKIKSNNERANQMKKQTNQMKSLRIFVAVLLIACSLSRLVSACPNAVYHEQEIIKGFENPKTEETAALCADVCTWLDYVKDDLCDKVQKNCNECVDKLAL